MKTQASTQSSRLAAVAILCGAWLTIAGILYTVHVSRTDHTDFFPRWAGARIALFEAHDPYTETSTRQIQWMVYGHLRPAAEDQQGFAYPAHVIPLLFPFWLLPMRIASALWSALSVLMTVALIYMLGQVPGRLLWVYVSTLATAQVLLVVFQGQFTLFVTGCLGAAYWLYTRSRNVAAGVLLVFATTKPELILLPSIALIAMAAWERRWTLLLTFLLGLSLAVVFSFAVTGFWIPRWLAQMRLYQAYAQSVWPVQVMWQHPLAAMLAGLILIGLASQVARWDRDLVFAMACVLDLILIPQTLPYSLAVLILPTALIVIRQSMVWATVIAAASWGGLLLPYRIQMTVIPLVIGGLVLFSRWRPSGGDVRK